MAPKEKPAKDDKPAAKGKKEEIKKKPRKYPPRPRVWKDHKDHSNKRQGPTAQQVALRERKQRQPKTWDRKFRKETSQGIRYRNIFEDLPELRKCWFLSRQKNGNVDVNKLKTLVMKSQMAKKARATNSFILTNEKAPLFRAPVDKNAKKTGKSRKPLDKKARAKRTKRMHQLKRMRGHDQKAKKSWNAHKFATMFGPYPKKSFLAMYFKDHPRPSSFVQRNMMKGLKLRKSIRESRLAIFKKVLQKWRKIPACVVDRHCALRKLGKMECFGKFMKIIYGESVEKVHPMAQAIVVQYVRTGFKTHRAYKKAVYMRPSPKKFHPITGLKKTPEQRKAEAEKQAAKKAVKQAAAAKALADAKAAAAAKAKPKKKAPKSGKPAKPKVAAPAKAAAAKPAAKK